VASRSPHERSNMRDYRSRNALAIWSRSGDL